MKKSFYAAMFAAALPVAAIAQAPEQENNTPNCEQISPTAEFCKAADKEAYIINTPEAGPLLNVPGSFTEDGQTSDDCILIVHPQMGPVAVACAEQEASAPAVPNYGI